MSGFEPLCQRVGEEIIRDQVEDLSRRKHACLFFYLPLSVSLHLALCFTFFVSLSLPLSLSPSLCPPTLYLSAFDPLSLSVCSFSLSCSSGIQLLFYVHICMHENPPVVEITTKSAAVLLPPCASQVVLKWWLRGCCGQELQQP